jgi:hypothetical protein
MFDICIHAELTSGLWNCSMRLFMMGLCGKLYGAEFEGFVVLSLLYMSDSLIYNLVPRPSDGNKANVTIAISG